MKFSSFGEGSEEAEENPGRDLNNSVARPPTTCLGREREREERVSAIAFSHSLPLLSCPRGGWGGGGWISAALEFR